MKINSKPSSPSPVFFAFAMLSFFLLMVSCKESSEPLETQESELITKINAVQEQIMAQGNVTEEEEQALLGLCSIISNDDGLANHNPEDRMILKNVDVVPVYNGCEELSIEETKNCFYEKVSSFIKREFNMNLSKDLNLSEAKQVDVFFVVNESGELTGMKVRDSEVIIQGEILRVLRKMPIMKPALHDGEPVSVLCSLQLTYGDDLDIDFVYIPEFPSES